MQLSIIVPTYNASRFIEETIHSVLNQSFQDWELIIIDDCSTDNTVQKLNEFRKIDQRIRVKVLDENSGAAIARNTGISMASGRYIAFLDSDDLWVPRKLEKQLNFMKENNVAFSFTGYEIIT
ncbi:glycosyltransferase family 2 protein, partial [Bacillus cereus]|nr:glycosyltransferase family 2 protein [Bacillus cereus]